MTRAVRVRVPATSANLGPGFDALGLALGLYDDVEIEMAGSGLSIEVSGEGEDTAGRGEGHLVAQTFRAAYAGIGGAAEGLRIRCVNRIPHARGLGSSSAATIAGILAARALHPDGAEFTDEDVLALATRIEGHPDNVAPCLAGGLTIAWQTSGGPRLTRLGVSPRVRPVALVPDSHLSTVRARGLLPEMVPHADAAANSGRAALLIAALTASPELLLDATEDRLHQSYRAPAMPESLDLVERLRGKGVAAVVSGAGPTVLALAFRDGEVDSIGAEVGSSWHIQPLDVAPHGACVQPIDQ
ncbi:homoserine kinase [Actinoallomurus bryophytorum]|uniref:Homoserine kinase n=1 Tax=Actinoallomurus bryophytorum TaxID=1490222 RepID=A0A543CNG0_9ACTN|nr:homoserine kinase [Actinoallomurus bryophytorum]TQL98635.1 homoserine kinase [Actinoallomurus bryophytorum]